jgi:hypothetical protein
MNIRILSLLLCLFFSPAIWAQRGFGLRFASHINHFPRHEDFDLVPGAFTSGAFGVFYRSYNAYGGIELGINTNYKNYTGKGMPNFPVVMRNFNTNGFNPGFTALETELKVGPRFGAFNPKIGYLFGYRFKGDNFSILNPVPDTMRFNKMYLMLPFGGSFDFFTGFGTVGVGAYYNVGLLNVWHRTPNYNTANSVTGGGIYPGGKWNSLNFEITVTFNSGEQGEYFDHELEKSRNKWRKKTNTEETPSEENSTKE